MTYSNVGETVLDFTMGSGSCGVAAKNTGRRFIGIEKDKTYFQIAQKRIEEAQEGTITLDDKQLSTQLHESDDPQEHANDNFDWGSFVKAINS